MADQFSVSAEVRIVLVDDHKMVRHALAQLLDDQPGIEVVGQAGDGFEAARAVAEHRPDVLVLDYTIPGGSMPLIEALSKESESPRIVVLTVHESIHYAVRVLEAGALAYVVKSEATEELVAALHAVHRDEVYISPKVSGRVLAQLRKPRKERLGLASLSPREFELLCLMGAGLSVVDAAKRLHIGTSTASTYRTRLMEKLALSSTAELIRFAIEQDLVG